MRSISIWFLLLALLGVSAGAQAQAPRRSLAERLTPPVLAQIFPGADRIGPEEGAPPSVAVFSHGELVGHIFSTLDVVAAPGYSSVPFDVVAGVDLSGIITGAKVLSHNEPHVLGDALRAPLLDQFLAAHAGWRLRGSNPGALTPDFVTAATVTARAMRDALLDSARMVHGARVELKRITGPTLDIFGYKPLSFADLLAAGSIVRRRVAPAEIVALFEAQYGAGARPDALIADAPEDFTDLYVALATPPMIGRNLMRQDFSRAMQKVEDGGQAILIASDGAFDFLGDTYLGQPDSYTLTRLRLVQSGRVFRFDRAHFQRLSTAGSDGVGGRRQAALFALDAKSGFDPLQAWRVEFTIDGTAPGGAAIVRLPVEYVLPAQLVILPGAEPVPAWVEAWSDARGELIVLGLALTLLTAILFFPDRVSRNRNTHRWLRNGFLLFTLTWLGWYAGGQFSILNVINYLHAPFGGQSIGFYLAEPLIVVIALYTAVSLVLLGRGVFCGWLCPFGALQELLAQTARALRLPQWNPSERLQGRLWYGKYVSALIVLALSFYSLESAQAAAEIEPFKTAISAHFLRAWPYVVYAGALLGIGLFTERGYCRFLCPLGGTLALLGHFHLLDLLKRRPECGSPCHLCERACPVKAIPRSGVINMDECFQCLDCQVEYNDDHRCPPLSRARKQKERLTASAPRPLAARA